MLFIYFCFNKKQNERHIKDIIHTKLLKINKKKRIKNKRKIWQTIKVFNTELVISKSVGNL